MSTLTALVTLCVHSDDYFDLSELTGPGGEKDSEKARPGEVAVRKRDRKANRDCTRIGQHIGPLDRASSEGKLLRKKLQP